VAATVPYYAVCTPIIRSDSFYALSHPSMSHWETLCTVCDIAYRLLSAVYMLLASEHYLRTYHPSLLRRRKVK
jgi:hypothetical protein